MIDELYWQRRWEELKIFNSDPNDKKKYFITVPWPYTSGPLHVGHGRTYTIADIIARFKRLQGYNVLFPMGFHESGTPIGSISEKIKNGDEKTIQLYKKYISEYETPEKIDEIMSSFKEPLSVANYFSDKIVKDFKALGYGIDWRRTFRSIDPLYSKMVQWQFRKLNSLKHLTRGSHAVLYSYVDENAVGEDDIDDGDTNKVSIEEFTMVFFKSINSDYYLAASSLRPETIFGITNLWINPECKYIKILLDEKVVVVSENASLKLKNQIENIKVLEKIDQREIIEDMFTVPYTESIIKVFANSNINPDQATGIVYSVPGHSVMDLKYVTDLKLAIDPIYVITINGALSNASNYILKYSDMDEANKEIYKKEYYEGTMIPDIPLIGNLDVKTARDRMNLTLVKSGFGKVIYETSRKAYTRDGKPVIVAIMHDQWFINYSESEWKDETRALVQKMAFYPEFYRKNMMDVIDWIEERACARKRGLGTRLPQDEEWIIESLSDSTIYPAFYTFSHLLKSADPKLIDDNLFDFVFHSEDKNLKPIMPLYTSARNEFAYWYGVDQRITSNSHMSNHLVFYLMNHTALFDEPFWPKGIMIGGTVVSNGAKISKSKGNAVSLLDVVETYGADLFRTYVALVAEIESVLDWNEKEIHNIKGIYENLNRLIGDSINSNAEISKDSYYELFQSKFKKHFNNYLEKMNSTQIRSAYVEIIYEVIKDINEFSSYGLREEGAIKSIIEPWLQALSCVMPHMAEHYWNLLGKKELISVTTLRNLEMTEDDEDRIKAFDFISTLSEDIKEIKSITKISPERIKFVLCNKEMKEDINKILQGNNDVKMKSIIGQIKKFKGKLDLSIDEFHCIKMNEFILKKIFNAEIEISVYEGDGKGKIPLPGRPLILLEGVKNARN
jgi:leucyl-tRNA synthetase